MRTCPHCEKPGIRSFLVGPGLPATCRECGGKAAPAWGESLAASSPVFLAIAVGAVLRMSLSYTTLTILAGGFVGVVLDWLFVPLQRR